MAPFAASINKIALYWAEKSANHFRTDLPVRVRDVGVRVRPLGLLRSVAKTFIAFDSLPQPQYVTPSIMSSERATGPERNA